MNSKYTKVLKVITRFFFFPNGFTEQIGLPLAVCVPIGTAKIVLHDFKRFFKIYYDLFVIAANYEE